MSDAGKTTEPLSEAAIRRCETKYRRLYEGIRDAFVSVGMDGRIQEYNEAYRQMLGYEPEELAALNFRDVTPARWHAFQDEIFEKQVFVRGYSDVYEKEYRRKDGTIVPVELRTILLRDDEGRPAGMWAILRDITQRKQYEQTLREAREDLERRVERRTAELLAANQQLQREIQERRQADEALRESHQQLQTIYDGIVEGLLITDIETKRFVRVNASFCRMLGYSEEELLGASVRDIHPPEEVPNDLRRFQAAAEGRVSINEDRPVLRKDGRIFYADITGRRIVYEGRPCLLALFRDVTERRRAEEALRTSEERFRSYFEQGLIGMAVTRIDKQWQEVNDRLCEILGYSRDELLAMKWTDATHPDDLETGLLNFNRMVAGETEHYTQDKRFLRKDGTIVYTTVFVRCFRRNGGEIDHILALIHDTTARKRAENALRESEERYRSVVEDQTEVISRLTAEGTFTFVNEVYCRFFGKTADQLLGRSWQPVALLEDVPMVEEQLRTLSPAHPIVVVENRVVSGRGEVRWMQFVNRGFFDERGRLAEIQSVGRDITERKRTEEALERERRTLKHLLQSSDHERQVIAYEIHDGLAQQLAGAIMQFDAYAAQKEVEPRFAAKAFEAGMTMLRQGHFETRRLISGVRPPILDEAGVVAAVAHLVNEERRKKGPKIEHLSEVEFERLTPILENAVYRIVQEGLTNACRHSRSKKIRVELVQQGDRLRIEIRDRGLGFRLEDVGESHFGVAGIRERARLLGGNAVIESEPGKGTRIVVDLPIVLRREEGNAGTWGPT